MDQSSAKPTIKLADFGDAVQLNTTYHIHPLLGNPEFAAPEIILGNPVSLTSDTWSVGVLAPRGFTAFHLPHHRCVTLVQSHPLLCALSFRGLHWGLLKLHLLTPTHLF